MVDESQDSGVPAGGSELQPAEPSTVNPASAQHYAPRSDGDLGGAAQATPQTVPAGHQSEERRNPPSGFDVQQGPSSDIPPLAGSSPLPVEPGRVAEPSRSGGDVAEVTPADAAPPADAAEDATSQAESTQAESLPEPLDGPLNRDQLDRDQLEGDQLDRDQLDRGTVAPEVASPPSESSDDESGLRQAPDEQIRSSTRSEGEPAAGTGHTAAAENLASENLDLENLLRQVAGDETDDTGRPDDTLRADEGDSIGPLQWDLLAPEAEPGRAEQGRAVIGSDDLLLDPIAQDAVAPRRGRRSASRPAGPPVKVQFSGMSDDLTGEPAELDLGAQPDVSDVSEEPRATPPTTSRSRRATRPAITVSFSAEPEKVLPKEPIHPAEISTVALFQPPEPVPVRSRRRVTQVADVTDLDDLADLAEAQFHRSEADTEESQLDSDLLGVDAAEIDQLDLAEDGAPRRRRRRGGRRRRRGGIGEGDVSPDGEVALDDYSDSEEQPDSELSADQSEELSSDAEYEGVGEDDDASGSRTRRRRRRRRAGMAEEMEDLSADDPPNTVVKVRSSRARLSDEVVAVRGSTRIEAKRQRRRDGREASRRRPPILTEAEFLARREAVNRVMAVRQHRDRTQIAVLEDGVLCEHYVNKLESSSLVGNVYLGRVQNVLPSMEAAFVDIGRGRNAVLYAGEVNWDAAGMDGQPKRIELALKAGDSVLVQATKDPMGHKGSRLTSQVSLPGRFLVYVPEGSMTGISRKLPDTERARLKAILKEVMPEGAGVIVRTAAEGATEEQLTADVRRLAAQWDDICRKAKSVSAPSLLYGEPDLAIKVVRDIFNEDFTSLVVQGAETWATLNDYIGWVAPDLASRMVQWVEPTDLYNSYRIDEQLAKALDRKVWLPSGGSLVIDRTEAMTVIDVNTGKFTGQGGNLEETVTRNNLEAAEEIVRQLRLRDIGGIIVIDFIDMVLESNRDLVLRRLVECLGRDRTRHQVAEVTSLGLVQMTRKRIGQGLLEVFSTPCEACGGRGHVIHNEPVGVGSDSDFTRRREDNGAGRRAPARVRLRAAPLGGKQTGKSPPPPKFDAEGHIYHDDTPATRGSSEQGDGGDETVESGAVGLLSGPSK